MFTIENGLIYTVETWLYSVVDHVDYIFQVTDLAGANAALGAVSMALMLLFFAKPRG